MRISGYSYALTSALCATLMGRLVHSNPWDLTSAEMAFSRNLGIAILLLPWVFRKFSHLFTSNSYPLWWRGALGAAGVVLFFQLLQKVPVSDALFLSNLAPVITLALAFVFLKERPSRRQMLGTLLIGASLFLRTTPQSSDIPLNIILFALLVCSVQALAYLSIKRSVVLFPPSLVIFTFCIATLMVTPWLGVRWNKLYTTSLSWEMVGLVVTGLGTQLFMTKAFEKLPAGTVTLLAQCSIFLATFIEVLLNERQLQWLDLWTTALLFVGLFFIMNLWQPVSVRIQSWIES